MDISIATASMTEQNARISFDFVNFVNELTWPSDAIIFSMGKPYADSRGFIHSPILCHAAERES
jgi:hypothetical protein